MTATRDDEVRIFLQAIKDAPGETARRNDLPMATRGQDKARQWAANNGLAYFNRAGWHLTARGMLWLCAP